MSSADKQKKFHLWLLRTVQWIVVGGCLLYAFWDLDIDTFIATIYKYNGLAVFLALSFTFAGFVALSSRLTTLSEKKLEFGHSIIGTIIGQGVNNILPAKLGEAVKAVYLARESGQTNAYLIGLVFWERFFDLNALVVLGLMIVLSASSPLSMGAFSTLVILIWLSLVVIRLWPGIAQAVLKLLPFIVIRDFLQELINHLIRGLSFIVILKASIWTLMLWFIYVGQVALILLWAAELDLSFTAVFVIFVVSGIGMNLAASPGGLGVYEAAIVASASWFGIGREEALASAIVLHVIQYLPTTLIGLLLMSRFNINYKQAKRYV